MGSGNNTLYKHTCDFRGNDANLCPQRCLPRGTAAPDREVPRVCCAPSEYSRGEALPQLGNRGLAGEVGTRVVCSRGERPTAPLPWAGAGGHWPGEVPPGERSTERGLAVQYSS